MASPPDDSGSRPTKRTKYDYFHDITVLVGEEKTRFVVHKSVACQTSEFFRIAIEGEWKEAREKTITLPEVQSKIFGTYLGWLYTGELDIKEPSELIYSRDIKMSELDQVHGNLIDAYALGEYLQNPAFRNAVVDEMQNVCRCTKTTMSSSNVTYLWESVAHNSMLAKLLVHKLATDTKSDVFDRFVSTIPHDIVIEVAKAGVLEKKMPWTERRPSNRPKCYYHEHEDEADKCK